MKIRSILTACSIGNFLEWYDYALYGYLTSVFANIFFPGNIDHSHFNALLVFAIGCFTRPLGSVIFGWIGDKRGRKTGLIYSIGLMIIPTFCMGLLPTYKYIGVASIILLAGLRLIQGIPVGGEIGGIICYLTEVAPPKQKVYFGSWSVFGSQIGFIVSSLEIYTFEKLMNHSTFTDWGWRISFVIGGILGIIGLFLRQYLHETRPFHKVIESHHILNNPAKKVFKNYKKHITQAFFLSCITSGPFYIVYFFSISFFASLLQISIFTIFLVNAAMLTLSTSFLPIFGKLGDRYGIKELLITSSIGVIISPYFMFYFAACGNCLLTFLTQAVLTLFLTLNYALLPALISSLFPTSVRYTGLGIAYNASNAVFGGLAPIACLGLIKITGSNLAPALYFVFLGVISLIPLIPLWKKNPLYYKISRELA